MRTVLALIGIAAILLYLRIPQRIDWESLRGFKGADGVQQFMEPITDDFNGVPQSAPTSASSSGKQKLANFDQHWMKNQCNPTTIQSGRRMVKEEYQRHLVAKDMGSPSMLKNPYCIHADGSKVFIPDWLVNEGFRLKVKVGEPDVIEKPPLSRHI